MIPYDKPLPRVAPLNAPFWNAARSGRLKVQRCDACEALRFPPLPVCDLCGSNSATWVAMSGRGTVWSKCTFHRSYFAGFAAEIPYGVVLVELEEGPMLYSNIVGAPFDNVAIGDAVTAVFEAATDEVTLVKFTPS